MPFKLYSVDGAAEMQQSNPSMAYNSHEDYWEDASVSLGCNICSDGSWGFNPVCCPQFPIQQVAAPHVEKAQTLNNCAEDACKGGSSRTDPCAPHADIIDRTPQFEKRSHEFPPPIGFCVTISIKEGGRFVLKEMDNRPLLYSCFRAERRNGRLRLSLIEPEQLDKDPISDLKSLETKYWGGEDGKGHYIPPYDDDDALLGKFDCDSEFSNDDGQFAKCDVVDVIDDFQDMHGGNVCDVGINVVGDCGYRFGENEAVYDVIGDDARINPQMVFTECTHDIAMQLPAGINDCSISERDEVKQENMESRSGKDVCIDSMGLLSEVPLPAERGPLWTVTDMAAHIRTWPQCELLLHGSFANMGRTPLGLTVS